MDRRCKHATRFGIMCAWVTNPTNTTTRVGTHACTCTCTSRGSARRGRRGRGSRRWWGYRGTRRTRGWGTRRSCTANKKCKYMFYMYMHVQCTCTVFPQSDAAATIIFIQDFVRRLFEGGIYSRAASILSPLH